MLIKIKTHKVSYLWVFINYPSYKIYQEKILGRNIKRPELLKAIRMLRNGDTLLIYKLDRLGRSTQYLINLMNRLNDHNIHLLSIVEGLNTRTAFDLVNIKNILFLLDYIKM